MKCPCCARKFRDKARYELYLRQKAIRADLEATCGPARTYIFTPASKTGRHREASKQFRQHGAA